MNPARAQDGQQDKSEESAQTSEGADEGTIVVTGSRTATNGNNAPTPVTIVGSDQLQETTPTNISDGLKKLPIFGNSGDEARTSNTRDNTVGNYLNLRGLGAIRTLILLDGRRVPSTAANGTVDTNILPQQLVERVDVVTGGASSVYGSDAITGVVNFVLDTKFTGVRGQAQTGFSSRGDASTWKVGLAAGVDLLDDRLHIMASVDHLDKEGIDDKFRRPSGAMVYSVLGQGTAASPFRLYANTRNSRTTSGGLITSGPLANRQFTSPGVLVPFVNGQSTGTAGVEVGGDGSYQSNSTLTPDLVTTQAFGRLDFDVTDAVKFFVQGNYARSHQTAAYVNLLFNGALIPADNAFLPQSARTAMANAGVTNFAFGRSFADQDPLTINIFTTNFAVTTGLSGDLGSFRWDIFYTHSRSTQLSKTSENINFARQAAALDAVEVGGRIVCRASITHPSLYGDCVPLNPFGIGAESREAIDYIVGTTSYRLTTTLENVGATVVGTPFSTWAGPVEVALNGEYRRVGLRNVSDALPTTTANCTGIRFGCNATTPEWFQGTTANQNASETIWEGSLEVSIPLLKDSPLGNSLMFNGAARYADYSISGSATTWKLGLVWEVRDGLTFRATRSRDFRAPTLNDLFQPESRARSTYNDLHTNTSALVDISTLGNPNLDPEISDTFTVGVVYRPSWLPRFSIAIDYFDIKLDNAITNVSGLNGITQAECEQSNGTSPRCALYIRPLPFSNRTAANFPTLVLSQPLNASRIHTRGVDAELNYWAPVGEGRLSLRGFATYQPKLTTIEFPGATEVNGAGAATDVAKWRLAFMASLDMPAWRLSIQERWRSSLKQSGNPTLVYDIPNVPAVAYTDVSFTLKPSAERVEVFFQVQNLFDKAPPVFRVPGGAPGFNFPSVPGDDVVGRYFTAGVRLTF